MNSTLQLALLCGLFIILMSHAIFLSLRICAQDWPLWKVCLLLIVTFSIHIIYLVMCVKGILDVLRS